MTLETICFSGSIILLIIGQVISSRRITRLENRLAREELQRQIREQEGE